MILALTLSACPTLRRPNPPLPPSLPPRPEQPLLQPVAGAQLYRVVPEQSLVRVLVYRGGAFAQVGHNHVIASHDLTGRLYVHKDLEKSAFELVMPVDKLTVDEPDLRREEGPQFPPEVPESAKQGTRQNMLGEAVLDGEHYPAIKLLSRSVSGTREQLSVAARIGVKDQWHDLTIPIALQFEGERLIASGEFEIRQTDLGLKPFSVLMGALQTQDRLQIKFRVIAIHDLSPTPVSGN
jgi:hypothetical protein